MPKRPGWAMLPAVLLMTYSCSSGTVVETTDSPFSGSTVGSIQDTSATTTLVAPTSTTNTTTMPPSALGLLTPTGVPVSVIDENPNGYLILTPCGFEVEIPQGQALGPVSVVLDPGHGGPTDTGAVGANGLAEKTVNLRVAERVADNLRDRGVGSVLTRTDDYTSPLFVRANLADTLQAELMVSIHHNAPTPGPSDRPGIEIFIQHDSDDSSRLGGIIWEHTMTALDVFDVTWTAAPDAGVMTVLNTRGDDAYGILRHPTTPAVLVELGYISNAPEAELFARDDYVEAAAGSIADAIEEYLRTENEGSGHVDGRVFNPQPGVAQEVCDDPDLN